MKQDCIKLDALSVHFEYERRQAEPEVGYLVDWWHYEVTAITVVSNDIMGAYNIHGLLTVDDLARIDTEIENYLNEK